MKCIIIATKVELLFGGIRCQNMAQSGFVQRDYTIPVVRMVDFATSYQHITVFYLLK